MSSVFGITPADMARKIVPAGGEYSFSVGTTGPPVNDMSTATVQEIIEAAEAECLGYLREKYQRLMRGVDGEILTSSAAGGETSFTLGLRPVTAGSVKLYKNFGRVRAWRDRRPSDAMEAEEYSVDATTGVVTLVVALGEGDVLWATYLHGAGALLLDLRRAAMGMAAAEIARRCAYFKTSEGFDRFDQWEIGARQYLRDLSRNASGMTVEMFERLELVNETRALSISRLFG